MGLSLDQEQTLDRDTLPDTTGQIKSAAEGYLALTILAHPNPARIGEIAALAADGETHLSRLSPSFARLGARPRRPLEDLRLSRAPIKLKPVPGGAVELQRETTAPLLVDGKTMATRQTVPAAALKGGIVLLLARRVALLLHQLPFDVPANSRDTANLVGESPPMAALRRRIKSVAELPYTVLLRGETGTGKELVAQAIHQASSRPPDAYFGVNLAAIPPTLAATELFGAEPGAYTGAGKARLGYFRRARGGTLFLDEIGEAPSEVQTLLLRTLENQEIQPLGAERPLKVDVRLIAATDRDLETASEEGTFKAPLLHRLAQVEIRIPPLRDRREDIGRLLIHFLRSELARVGADSKLADPGPGGTAYLSAELVARLAAYDWPGNVRQLQNVVRRLVVDGRDASRLVADSELEKMLAAKDKRNQLSSPQSTESPPPISDEPSRDPASVTEDELRQTLRRHKWNLRQAATALRLPRTSLYEVMTRAGLRIASQLDQEEIETTLERCDGRVDLAARELEVSCRGLQIRLKSLARER